MRVLEKFRDHGKSGSAGRYAATTRNAGLSLLLKPLACAVAAALSSGAWANPVGPQVAAGSAAFQAAGRTLTVTSTPGTILNWQSFSIGAGEITRFQQQSALSAVLNRVTGGDPSSILGTLSSNGRVFLINPHGIVFGQGAVIDTAGFVASTLNMRNEDFLAGRMKFEGGGEGVLRNEGTLRASGDIFLVGPQIENAGIIRSDNGSVVLAAGRSLTITSPDAQGVQFALQAPADAVLNLGAIEAGNAAALFAGTLRHSGDIRATSASIDAAGRVILAAQKDAIVDGNATISVDNTAGKGGSVQITGERVGVFDNATVTARGITGGGEILVGGDVQGGNPAVRNAAMTYVSSSAMLDASATATGDGGKVIAWADDTARVHGSIIARGDAQGGAGGFIETSGKRYLDVSGIRVDASGNTPGNWLLDPYNIEIVAGAGTTNNGGAPSFVPGGDNSQIGVDLIVAQLDAGTGVTLNTAGAGAQAGNIVINAPIVKTANNAAGLILTADNDITVNQNISLSTNNLATSTTSGANASLIATAGGTFSINNATVEAFHISVDAASISRSGAQANDFVFGFVFPTNGTMTLTTQSGAVGSLANPIRFANPDFAGRTWAINTVNAGAAGNIFIQPTKNDYGTFGGTAIQTDPATTQTVYLNHTGTGTFSLYGNISGNDDWILNSAGSFSAGNFAGSFAGPVSKLTANSITATVAGNFGGSQSGSPGLIFDTSAANGNITMTGQTFHGTGCGGDNVGFGIAPGTGTVTATSTPGAACGGDGSIQLAHFGGDLLTSRYVLNFTGGGAGNYMRLKAVDGNLIVDSTAGFNASLNNKETLLQTLTAGKDIIFQGGTVQGGRVEIRSARNIDNLAPGTNGFIQTNAVGGPYWKLYATGGGIGLTNPVEGVADWIGELVSGGAGALGDINVKFNTGGTPGIATISTPAGSVQNIGITAAGSLGFAPGQPGFGGAFSTANDHYTMNVGGTMIFTMFNDSATAASFDLTVAGSAINNGCCGTSGRWISTTGALSITSTGGSIGQSTSYANLPASGGMTLGALNDIYVDAGANPLTLAGITTGVGAGTIGLRTTGANDITLGGTTNINDNLILNSGRNIIFPATADFTTSGGLTLNAPTQIAATAAVTVSGGAFAASSTFDNAGTLTKGNSGTSTFSGAFTNSGTLNVNAGTLNMNAGMTQTAGGINIGSGATLRLPAGTTSTWSGGTLTQAGSGSTLMLEDSTLTLDADITNSGTLHLQNFATLNGSGTVTNTGNVNIYGLLGSMTPVVFAANLVNQGNVQTRDAAQINGAFTNAASGTFLNNDSGTLFANGFTNAGTLLLYSDANYEPLPVITITSGTLLNTGTISTIGSEVRDRVIAAQFNNQGTVTASVGRLVIDKAGASHVNTGAMNAGGDNILVQLSGGGSFTHGAGTITAASGRSFGVSGGVYDWQGGTLSGAGSFNPAGGMTLSGSGARVLNGPTLNLGATALSTGSLAVQSGVLNFSGVATIGPAATLEVAGGTVTGALSVDVQGLLKMSGGVLNAASVGLLPGGTLSGTGTINAPVLNDGSIVVGASPGTLVVNGNYAQTATGVLDIELGGTVQGVNYDLLQVTGTANLNGTMNVSLFGGFTGAAGNAFDVMTYASRTGDFATVNFPAGVTMTATPNPALYQLVITAVPVTGGGSSSSLSGETLLLAANDARVLLDRFVNTVDPGKSAEDDEKKGAVLECK